MMKLPEPIKTPKGVLYSEAPQGSPEWVQSRYGRIGASELHPWMLRALVTDKETKQKTRTGAYLKGHHDLVKQKAFEITFNTTFHKFVTGAMQQGIDNEDFVRDQYGHHIGEPVQKAGAFYDEFSVASPDGLIGTEGGVEIKWLQDATWAEIVASATVPEEHYYQCQGNLRLSGRKWWDYVAANGSTGRFIVLRVYRDEQLIAEISKAVEEVKDIKPLKTDNVFEFTNGVPANIETEDQKWD